MELRGGISVCACIEYGGKMIFLNLVCARSENADDMNYMRCFVSITIFIFYLCIVGDDSSLLKRIPVSPHAAVGAAKHHVPKEAFGIFPLIITMRPARHHRPSRCESKPQEVLADSRMSQHGTICHRPPRTHAAKACPLFAYPPVWSRRRPGALRQTFPFRPLVGDLARSTRVW